MSAAQRLNARPDAWGGFMVVVDGTAANTVGGVVCCGVKTEDSARRLAAAWNACEGLSTEALDNLSCIGGLEVLREYSQRVKAQRDELQATLDWMKKNHDLVYQFIGASGDAFLDRVRDEMQREKGGA